MAGCGPASWRQVPGEGAACQCSIGRPPPRRARPRSRWRQEFQPIDQRHRGGGRAHLALVDHVGEHVARCCLRRALRIDLVEILRHATRREGLEALGPGIQFLGRIAGRDRVLALLQAQIDEVGRDVGDARIGLVLGAHDRGVEFADQRDEGGVTETVMAHLDDVTQPQTILLFGQQLEERAEVGFVELLGRRELPQQGTEPVAELGHAGIEEALDRVRAFGQHPAVGGEAGGLHGEQEAVRRLARPFAECFGLLRAVIGRIDLDRGQFRSRVVQLFGLRQLVRIENAAPRLEIPPADADIDRSGTFRFVNHCITTLGLPYRFRRRC